MKNLILFFCLALSAGLVNAQDTTTMEYRHDGMNRQQMMGDSLSEVSDGKQNSGMVKIELSALPALVAEQLKGDEYTTWTVIETYRQEKDKVQFYFVKLRNGERTKTIRFDNQGNTLTYKVKDDQ